MIPSYHDLCVTTDQIERTSVFNLPFSYMITCTRTGGWELWRYPENGGTEVLVAGEYNSDEHGGGGLRLDVAGHVIVDSLKVRAEA